MRILLVDDHTLVRDALAAFLAAETSATVTTAATLDEGLERIDRDGPFDLILLDYAMPGMNGIDRLGEVIAANAGKPVAIVSGSASRDVAETALAAGAAGFVPKTLPAKSMANAVRFMAAGEQYAPVDWMTAPPVEAEPPEDSPLTARELQVVAALCDGLTNKEIARALDLQEVTIKLHIKTLSRKLNARNRTHAAILAKERGLV